LAFGPKWDAVFDASLMGRRVVPKIAR